MNNSHKMQLVKTCNRKVLYSISGIYFALMLLLITPANGMLTIEEAATTAVENNFSIQIAEKETEIAESDFSRGHAGFWPTLSLQAGQDLEFSDSRQEFADESIIDEDLARATGLNAGVLMEYPLFTGFDRQHHYQSLNHALAATRGDQKAAVEDLLLQVTIGFHDIRRLQKLIEVTENSIEISTDRVQIAENQYEVGSGSRMELLQARADLNEERSLLLQQEEQLKQQKVQFNELLARPVDTEFEVAEELTFRDLSELEEQKQQALQYNPEIQAQQEWRNMSERLIGREKSQRYPQLGLQIGYDFGRSTSEAGYVASSRSLGLNVGVNLRMNIFDGFNTSRRIETAELNREQQELRLQEQEQRILAEIEEARVRYENALTRLELEQENAEVVEENIEVALEQYEQGMIISVELREAQKTLLESQARLRNVEREAKVAEARLLKLTGQLEETFVL